VFGKSKKDLYKNYPNLAKVTHPKMHIFTPRGDEVIHRRKFDEALTILKDMQVNEEEKEDIT
jgi:hypothetical protein